MRQYPRFLAVLALTLLASLTACQAQRSVLIQADGQSRLVPLSRSETVGDALEEAGLTLGEKDRVTPDIYARLPRSGSITVVRVRERTETELETLPFGRKVLLDDFLPKGETRPVQTGVPGQRQRVYLVTLEDGIAVRREQVSDRVTREPVDEVLREGMRGALALAPAPITGSLVYLSSGNAWVVRNSTTSKRPVTFSGDLDGRVLALSANGGDLAYTRRPVSGTGGINSLWLINSLLAADQPLSLQQQDVLGAEWRGDSLLFTTGQSTAGAPGWKANNDLWLLPASGAARQPLPSPGAGGVYAWWGRDYALSPNGKLLAYAAPDEVGVLDLLSGDRRVLASFAPARSNSDWVWTPGLSWKSDSSALAAVVHGSLLAGQPIEDSSVFDLWSFPVNGATGTRLAGDVGMWALPSWSPDGRLLAYGVAREPAASATSGYDLWIMNLEQGASRRFLSGVTWGGSPPQPVVWSPLGVELVVSYQGDLYLAPLAGGQLRALTNDGHSSNAQWR
jgi:resuscitation-promoting factor RpfB